MTVGGTAAATGVLLVLLIAAGAVGWNLVSVDPDEPERQLPGLAVPAADRRRSGSPS